MMAPNASRKRSTLTRIVLVVLVGALMGVTLPGELGTAPPFPSAHSAFTVAATAGSSATSPRSAPQVTLNESTLVLFNNSLIQGDYDSVSSSLPSLEVFDPTSNELFVEGFYSGVIDVVSTELNEVVATISTGAYPNTLAYDSQNNNIYFGLQEADLVGTVNASTGLVQRTVNIGFEPLSMAADPVSCNLFVTGWNATGTAFLAVISGASGVVLTSFPFANGWFPVAGPNGLAYVPASGNFYLASFPSGVPQYQPGNLTLVDASTFAVVANVSLPFAPSSVLYAPSTRNLYLGNSSGDNLSVFDPATTSLVGSIQLPNLPTMLTYASTHERVYVGLDGNVSAVSTTLNKVTKTFPVTREPDGLAFDSHDGDLYISDYVWN